MQPALRAPDLPVPVQSIEIEMTPKTAPLRPQVGVPDQNLEASPIVGEDEDVEVESNVAGGGCAFNSVSYVLGDFVQSPSETLRCEQPGISVRKGEPRSQA